MGESLTKFFNQIVIADEISDQILMKFIHDKTDRWFSKRAIKPQNRAENGIYSEGKGLSKIPFQ